MAGSISATVRGCRNISMKTFRSHVIRRDRLGVPDATSGPAWGRDVTTLLARPGGGRESDHHTD